MSARTKARKRALDMLYESELRGLGLDGTLDQRISERVAAGAPLNPYAITLVQGVVQHQEQIDALLAATAIGWSLERMPAIDRNLLRLGTFEILHSDDVPPAVAISEAVGLAQQLSTDDSAGFVNGVLARIAGEQVAPTS